MQSFRANHKRSIPPRLKNRSTSRGKSPTSSFGCFYVSFSPLPPASHFVWTSTMPTWLSLASTSWTHSGASIRASRRSPRLLKNSKLSYYNSNCTRLTKTSAAHFSSPDILPFLPHLVKSDWMKVFPWSIPQLPVWWFNKLATPYFKIVLKIAVINLCILLTNKCHFNLIG